MGSNVFKFPGTEGFSASWNAASYSSASLVPVLNIPSFQRRPKVSQAQFAPAGESWGMSARRRAALRLVESAGTSTPATKPDPGPQAQPLRVLRLVEAGQAPGTAGRLRMSGRLADVCAELDRMASEELSRSHALRA